MRITIWLSIAVFVTTLYWSHLLTYSGTLFCVLSAFIFLFWRSSRYLAILPLTALYFSIFVQSSLLGFSFESMPFFEEGQTDNSNITAINILHDVENRHQYEYLGRNAHQQRDHFLSNILSDEDNIITIEVKSLINVKNNGYFIANLMSINNKKCDVCPLIEMRWFKPTLAVQAGQVHQFNVRFKALQGKGNPEGFDRQKWRYSEHIAYIANIKQHIHVINSSLSLRAQLYEKTLDVTEHLVHQGAIIALIFADKSLINRQEKELIKQLGIAHLFAISGLHIGLLFIFSFVIVNTSLKKLLPVHLLGWFSWRLVHLIGFLVCLAYGYISGFSLPTQRALFMLLISVLMFANKRKVGMFDLLILCLWLILLVDPLAILSSSLWLSFTAMSAIFVFIWGSHSLGDLTQHDETTDKPSRWRLTFYKVIVFIRQLLLLQIMLTLFMLPIQLINFSAISLFSLGINLIAIPFFSWFVIPVTLLGSILLMVVEPLGRWLFVIADYLLALFLGFFNGFSTGYVSLSELTITLILSFFIFITLISLLIFLHFFCQFNKKMGGAIMLLLMVFVAVRVYEIAWHKKQSWQVEVFDIGQGLAVLIKSDGHYLLYDTGPSYSPHYAVADVEILPYLQARGINTLDYLMVSHSDNDHAGGAKSIVKSLNIKHAYAGEAALMNTDNALYEQCLSGQHFYVGKLSVAVLSPTTVGKNNNDNSCVIKVSDGVNSVLLTGDISKIVEQKLASSDSGNDPSSDISADILIAPHHGSKTSSSLEFIQHVNPRWVVFSAGYKNRWHFPKSEVVQRYKKQGVTSLITGDSGFIRFNVENQHIEVKTYREDLAAYWYHQQLVF